MPVYRNTWPNFCKLCIHVHHISVMWSLMFSALSHSSWMMIQGKTIFVYSCLLLCMSLLTQNCDKFGNIVYGLYFKLLVSVWRSPSDTLWIPFLPWSLVSTLLPTRRIFSWDMYDLLWKMWLRAPRSWVNLWKLLQIEFCWLIGCYHFPFSCLICFMFSLPKITVGYC